MIIKEAVLVFVLLTVDFEGTVSRDVAVVPSCPPPSQVVPMMDAQIEAGNLKSYVVTCSPATAALTEKDKQS